MTNPGMIEHSNVPAVQQQSTSSVSPMGMPQPIDTRALRNYLKLINNEEAFELQQQLASVYDKACAALIGENDVQVEGQRSFKKKTAWKKLARYFGISTQVVRQDERYINDAATGDSVFVASCTVRASAPWGQIAESVGACATDEETGRRKITIADAIATAETRASNRAISNLIAMGEVSAEELSKTATNEVQQQSVRELTIDEAMAYPFPWKQPKKYAGKPLGELSTQMLTTVKEAVEKEIGEKGETPKRAELLRAVVMNLEARANDTGSETGDAAAGTQQREPGDESDVPERDESGAPVPAGSGSAALDRERERVD